jgi:hypothetical protein
VAGARSGLSATAARSRSRATGVVRNLIAHAIGIAPTAAFRAST